MSSVVWKPKKVGLRLPGWEAAFVQSIGQHFEQPFAWGVSDCLIIPGDLCQAMTGVNVFPKHLRKYRSAAGAYRLLKQLGFDDVDEALAAVFPEVPLARAQRGDCGVRRIENGRFSTFIVINGGMAMGKGEGHDRVVIPVLELERTFAIGARGGI